MDVNTKQTTRAVTCLEAVTHVHTHALVGRGTLFFHKWRADMPPPACVPLVSSQKELVPRTPRLALALVLRAPQQLAVLLDAVADAASCRNWSGVLHYPHRCEVFRCWRASVTGGRVQDGSWCSVAHN